MMTETIKPAELYFLPDTAAAQPDTAAATESETTPLLQEALSRLPAVWRRVLQLRYGIHPARQPHTYQDIAKRLGLSKQRIKQIESQALKRLYEMLGKDFLTGCLS